MKRSLSRKTPVQVINTPIGVVVTGIGAPAVRRAITNLFKPKTIAAPNEETRKALILFRVVGRFYKNNGRFKNYKKRKKTKLKPTE